MARAEYNAGRGLLRLPRPAGVPPAVPLTFAQLRLWTLEQWAPGLPSSIITALWQLAGTPRPATLARALERLVARHEALRCRLRPGTGGEVVQVVTAPARLVPPAVDLAALAPAHRDTALRRLAVSSGRRPFDLVAGPPLRCTLVRLAPAGPEPRWALLASVHHLVADSTSLGVLAADLTELCQAGDQHRPPRLPELPAQFPDFAASQRLRLRGPALEAELDSWCQLLAQARPLALPLDRPRPELPRWRCRQEELHLLPADATALLELGRRHGASPFLLLLTGLLLLLARLSGQHDLVLGSSLSQRHLAETAGMVGLLVHTLTLRTSLAGDPDFPAALERTRQATFEAFRRHEVPHEEWLRRQHPERDPVRDPLARVAFTLRAGPSASPGVAAPLLCAVDLPQPSARFDLEIHVWLADGGAVRGLGFYDPDLFDACTIRRWLGHWLTLLRGLVADPTLPLSRLPLLSPAQRHQLLYETPLEPHGSR